MREHRKTPRLDPQDAVRAALEILDSQGLEHVTLRQVASKLGVQAPALYWHFKDKQDLLDDMAQVILKDARIDEVTFPSDIDRWDKWLTDTAYALRKALLSHREGAKVVAGASLNRAKALAKLAIHTTRVMEAAGFDLLHASLTASTVINYVWGDVIEEQAGEGPEPGTFASNKESAEYKAMLEMVDGLEPIVAELDRVTQDQRFDWGLQVIISGLKSSLKEQQRKRPHKKRIEQVSK